MPPERIYHLCLATDILGLSPVRLYKRMRSIWHTFMFKPLKLLSYSRNGHTDLSAMGMGQRIRFSCDPSSVLTAIKKATIFFCFKAIKTITPDLKLEIYFTLIK
jgi:hypothetical protein